MKAATFIGLCLLMSSPVLGLTPGTRFIIARDGQTIATVAPEDTPLIYTRQFTAADAAGAVEELRRVLPSHPHLRKVNVVATSREEGEKVRPLIRERLTPDMAGPPISVVIGRLPDGAAVGVDVIVATGRAVPRPHAAELPRGPRVYISGQAEPGATPAEAAATTIQSLLRTLEFVGSTPKQVVQARCFLTPVSAAADVTAAFERLFSAENVPPLVFVEWKSDLPIEIELIAAAPPAAADAPVIEYLTPPGKAASPLFARVVKVNRGGLIHIGDIGSAQPGSGEVQVTSIFEQLQDVLKQSGSDLRHLVKATYYVSDNDASKQLNVIRPKFYDPKRPPAASKAMVPAVGVAERSITIDMVAVPAAP
jgi:enamine deaminase RidA (YjgF/YER057c/UK114 family)